MVLTRFQQANLNSREKQEKSNSKSTDSTTNEAALVQDPPLLTISRSRDSFDDDLNETAVKVNLFLEQLDE